MFRSMNYVYEVYKEQSFSKAAANLYISQPSLSATVKKVEERLGEPIFDRSVNPIQLTECGKYYIKAVEEILDIQERFENYLNDTRQLRVGQLTVGGSNLFASYLLPPLITRFTQKYPTIKIEMVEANTSALMDQLFRGRLDFVIDNAIFPPDLYDNCLYFQERLLLAVPRIFQCNQGLEAKRISPEEIGSNRDFSDKQPVDLAHFEKEPFLFLRSGNDTHSRALTICKSQQFSPHIKLELDQLMTAYHLCCSGVGITFISDTVVKHVPDRDQCFYYLVGGETAYRNVYFYYKKNRYFTRAMREFLNLCSGYESAYLDVSDKKERRSYP